MNEDHFLVYNFYCINFSRLQGRVNLLVFFSRGFHNGRWTHFSPRCATLWEYSRLAAPSVPRAPLPSPTAGEQPAPPVPTCAPVLSIPVLLPLPQHPSPQQSPPFLPRHDPPQGLPPASCPSPAALPSAVQPAAPGQGPTGCPPAWEGAAGWAGAAAALGAGECVWEGGKALPSPAAAPGLCWWAPRGSAGSQHAHPGFSADTSCGSAAGPSPEGEIQPCAAAPGAAGIPPARARRGHPQTSHPAEPGHHAPPAGAGGDEEGSGASPAGPGAAQPAAEPSQATSARSADHSWADQLHSEAASPSAAARPG